MKQVLTEIRDTLAAGLLFLLPLLIVIVLITKGINLLSGLSVKLANLFGLKSLAGISGHTIMSGILILLICYFCGLLMRLSFVKRINHYVDQKLEGYIPGYKNYREMAKTKLPKQQELPYKYAAWLNLKENVFEPGFVIEELPGERYLVFVPQIGNTKEGKLMIIPSQNVQVIQGLDVKSFQTMINKQDVDIATTQSVSKKN